MSTLECRWMSVGEREACLGAGERRGQEGWGAELASVSALREVEGSFLGSDRKLPPQSCSQSAHVLPAAALNAYTCGTGKVSASLQTLHRITEGLRLAGASGGHLVQQPYLHL